MAKGLAVGVVAWGLLAGGFCDADLAVPVTAGFASSVALAEELPVERRGTVKYNPPADNADGKVAKQFRLDAHTFAYREQPLREVSKKIAISRVTFPSPVTTPHIENNTVHCEYYRPKREGRRPAVVVLHILGGDFELARTFCNAIAHRGTGALFLKMPYYGPRRVPGVKRRMVSRNPNETVEGMTQAILDIRRATAWLAAREDVDPKQLGVFGISLGGITGALAAGVEPRLQNVCLLLAGGDVGRIAWESDELAESRKQWLAQGNTKEQFLNMMASVDPITYAPRARGRRILMLNALEDEVVPKACTESLWVAFGKPRIVWYSGGHYSVSRHFFKALNEVTTFLQRP